LPLIFLGLRHPFGTRTHLSFRVAGMVGVNLAGVGDWAIGSSRAGLALATRLAVVEISKASKKSSRGAVSSAAIEVPVSANAMLSPEIRNRYAATGIYHVIRRGTRGRGTDGLGGSGARAASDDKPQGRTAPFPY